MNLRKSFAFMLLAGWSLFLPAQEIKNVILMIPDGTPTALLSVARWYQQYQDSTLTSLYVDPYLCGMVKTFCSDAPIGDSAPTTSCYMTGMPSKKGYVSTYPPKTNQDLVPVDATRAYQPLVTLWEAAKMLQHKATGLVFTCEFPHATPADCAAHTYNRADYKSIASQMAYNQVDVVIGGGVKYLTPELADFLKSKQYSVILNDKKAFEENTNDKVWSLFCEKDTPYDIDRNPDSVPSLAEMTAKAIDALRRNENGFVLMVEGSKVDYAGHKNMALQQVTDFLAFDKAVKVAIDFAKKDGHTVVVIVPDHGNGGLNLGNTNSNGKYATIGLKDLFDGDMSKNLGYTTTGHTGEDVFLACYHPAKEIPTGLMTNIELHQYLCQQLNLENQLPLLNDKIFAKHQDVFNGMTYSIETKEDKSAILTVKNKKKTLVIQSSTNYVMVGKEKIELSSIIVYQDVNKTFYLPKDLRKYLE